VVYLLARGFSRIFNEMFLLFLNPEVIMTVPLGHHSQRMTCPHCGSDVMTATTHESGLLTHLCALGLCLVQ